MFVFLFFILGLVLGGFVVVFALQNTALVEVTFFSWHLDGSLALILLAAALLGVLVALLITIPKVVSSYFAYTRLTKEHTQLEEELRRQKELTHFARKTSPNADDLAKIEQGAIDQNRTLI